MEAEVKRLGPRAVSSFSFPKPKRLDEQTLTYPFDPGLARLAVHYLRTPSRAFWDLFFVEARRLEPLYADLVEAVASDDRPWLFDGAAISVDVRSAEAFEAGPLQIRGTVKNAIIEGARRRGLEVRLDADDPTLAISVRGEEDGLLVSVDLAGRSLHLRGWRTDDAPAALKETLAAQMLILARWDPRKEILLDPMAGTGTIPAEAALAAVGRKRWIEPRAPILPAPLQTGEPLEDLFPGTIASVVAHEIHTPSFDKVQDNLQRAGVAGDVVALHGDLKDLTTKRIERALKERGRPVHPAGIVVVNPPYGVRLPVEDAVYEALAALVRRLGCRAAVLAGNPAVRRIFGEPRVRKPMYNGPLAAELLLYDP